MEQFLLMEHHSIGIIFGITVLLFLAQFITEGMDIHWVAGSFNHVDNSINYLPEKHQWEWMIRGSENVCFDKLKLNNSEKKHCCLFVLLAAFINPDALVLSVVFYPHFWCILRTLLVSTYLSVTELSPWKMACLLLWIFGICLDNIRNT